MQAKQPNRSSSSSWQDKTVDRRVVNTLFCGDFFHHVDDTATSSPLVSTDVVNFVTSTPQGSHKLALILSQETKQSLAMDRYKRRIAAQVCDPGFQ